MAASGQIVARCLAMLTATSARPGVTTAELDRQPRSSSARRAASPPSRAIAAFPASICASPNSMVVHGIPGDYELARGDVISLDVGVELEGWVADAAVTVALRPVSAAAGSS